MTITLLPSTIRSLIQRGDYRTLISWSAFKNVWFAAVWAIFGPMFAEGGSPVVGPLIKNARGVELDIGPGAGDWVRLFKMGMERGGG